MDITRMSDEELAAEIRGRCITNMAADDLVKFIRQCVKDSQKDMWELIDGAEPIISIWQTESPGQVKFKELWLTKAREALASVEGKGKDESNKNPDR